MWGNEVLRMLSDAQWLTVGLIGVVVCLEIIQIGQIGKIRKQQEYALKKIREYLEVVFSEDENGETDAAEQQESVLDVPKPICSRQEQEMRAVLTQKKQQKEDELLETVLEEIFE